jgi:EmrB/QacA subfamily drug resistance transporter
MTTSSDVATARGGQAPAVRGELTTPADGGHNGPERAQPETGRRRWAVLAVVSAAQFLIILDLWIVNIALPVLRHDFAPATLPDVSWILDAYAIVLAALLLPSGRAADSIGRRRLFLAGLVIFGLASLGCAAAADLPALIAFRALQAVGAAVLLPTSLGLALSAFPARQRGTAVGIWAGVGAVAAGSGPVIGGLLVESSWRWIFLINVPIVVATFAAGVPILPRSGDHTRQRIGRRIDPVGALLVLAAIGLVCTALTEAPGWPLSRTLLLLVAGLAAAAAFAVHIHRHSDPLISPRLFAARRFTAGSAGLVAYYAGFAGMLLGTTTLLTVHWHLSVLQAAAAIAPGPITAGIVSPFSGRLSARFGMQATVAAGAAFFASAAGWLLVSAGANPDYSKVVLPTMLLWGVANALIQPSLLATADTAPRSELASGSAVLAAARQIGAALGVAIFVAAVGAGPARDLARLDRAWIVVLITAALTGAAGLAAGRWRNHGAEVPARGKKVVLRDRSAVLIRQIQRDDAPLLADAFDRLSPRSRQLRFMRPKHHLTPAELRYFTDIDHHDHEALGALDNEDGRGVGFARYIRDADDPHAAEIAVTIIDDWQGKGLGTELLTRLTERARQEGIRRFTALVSSDNVAMTRVLRNMSAKRVGYGPGTEEYEVPLSFREGPAPTAR